MKVMLVDDDAGIVAAIEDILTQEGYSFVSTPHATQALALIEKEQPDLIILDVMMPGMNGFDLCYSIREKGIETPVLFLSAKGDIVDKSVGFKVGGDDYMVKPFDPIELRLRVEALLRRSRKTDEMAAPRQEGQIKIGDLEIFFDRYEIRKAGELVRLSSKEFEIVSLMASSPGKVFTREQILQHIWGDSIEGDLNNVTVFIRRIREKLETNPAQPTYLLTVWRVGYKFASEL
jgi:DNA-binding response OmpR family regulator